MARYVKNNQYASTITRESAIKLAKKALSVINEDDCYFLSTVAQRCGTYRGKFAYVQKKFADDEEVNDLFEIIRNRCEDIVLKLTAKGKINIALGIFWLKAGHGLAETTKTEHEMKLSDLTDLYKKAMSSNKQVSHDEVPKLNAVK